MFFFKWQSSCGFKCFTRANENNLQILENWSVFQIVNAIDQFLLFFTSDLFRLKYEDQWLHCYELAKASLNNRANEIRSGERKSNEPKEDGMRSAPGPSQTRLTETVNAEETSEEL